MNAYKTYFDRQTISPALHARLAALVSSPAQMPPSPLPNPEGNEPPARLEKPLQRGPLAPAQRTHRSSRWIALAACAALIVLGWKGLSYQWQPPLPTDNIFPLNSPTETQPAVDPTFAPDVSDPDPVAPPEDYGFLIHSPTAEERLNFYDIPSLNFQEGLSEVAACLALPEGSFYVELTLEDLQKVFWGPECKPESTSADLPWVLGWDGYTVQIGARYDGNGDLWMLSIYGSKGLDSFELQISPGRLPPQCLADPGGESADVNGTEVTSYYHAYDWDGDGLTDHVCTSEFLVDGYGYRFRNVYTETGEEEYDVAEAAKFQNACFVMRTAQWTDSRCYFGHIVHTDNIPAWEETPFDTLADARERADFAPYLPETAPVNWGEFHGRLSYQEGNYNYLFVRWSRMYDNVEIDVHLPEGEDLDYYHTQLVDVNVPESYDWRLYDGPISDTVPPEYRMAFYKPAFRAEDMSLEVVKARMHDHDTGGEICHFYVIHENGVVVSYDCSGVTAETVWAMIEPTL